jgi:membrane dipeptidase
LTRLKAGMVGGQFWSVWIPAQVKGENAVIQVMEQITRVRRLIARYPDYLELALTADDVERIHKKGKVASMIGMEGGNAMNNSLETLRLLYAMGARYMTLTHTINTDWADSAGGKPLHHGLTPFGEDVVREMNRIGMLVDISHVSDETMKAAIKVSKAPVIFSHSSARAVCNHLRNVPDDVLKMLATNGGVCMVSFVPEYVTEADRLSPRGTPPKATFSDVADHIDHIRKVAGIDYIGIGSDYDGFQHPPQGLEDVSCYPNLIAELLRRGYSEEDVKKVAGNNVLRVMRAVEKFSQQSNP